jgi:hypothetical protein
MKKFNHKKILKPVTITGISDWRASHMGGRYRYIYVEGLDPSSLYENMTNFSEWDQFVKKIQPGKRLRCEAEVITRKGKTFMSCDTVPTVIEPPKTKHQTSASEASGLAEPCFEITGNTDLILELDRKLERSAINVDTRFQNGIYEIYGPNVWAKIRRVTDQDYFQHHIDSISDR